MVSGLAGVLLAAMPSAALADIVFDFAPLWPLEGDAAISAYMTDIYNDTVPGGTVTVTGARAALSGIGIGQLFGKSFQYPIQRGDRRCEF